MINLIVGVGLLEFVAPKQLKGAVSAGWCSIMLIHGKRGTGVRNRLASTRGGS